MPPVTTNTTTTCRNINSQMRDTPDRGDKKHATRRLHACNSPRHAENSKDLVVLLSDNRPAYVSRRTHPGTLSATRRPPALTDGRTATPASGKTRSSDRPSDHAGTVTYPRHLTTFARARARERAADHG